MNRRIAVASVLVACVQPFNAFGDDRDCSCAEVLREGIFSRKEFIQTSKTNDRFLAWQCSASFETHDDAINGGLTVGAVVYGVPLEVGATWDESKVSAWKRENCSMSHARASRDSATYSFLEQEARGVVRLQGALQPEGHHV